MYELQIIFEDGSVLYIRGLALPALQGAMQIFFSGAKHVWFKNAKSEQAGGVQSAFICSIAAPGEKVNG
jgi:hypothetical protein